MRVQSWVACDVYLNGKARTITCCDCPAPEEQFANTSCCFGCVEHSSESSMSLRLLDDVGELDIVDKASFDGTTRNSSVLKMTS